MSDAARHTSGPLDATAPVRVASAAVWRKGMQGIAAILKWVALGALVLAASFVTGGLYQGVAMSNGNQAGDIYVFNRFTGAYYVCRNRNCQPGKYSP
jgi:hypothetical protein